MVDKHKENNVFGGESCAKSGVAESSIDAAKANGSATGSSGLGSGLLTYKRRKSAKVVEDGMIWDDSGPKLVHKSVKNLSHQANQKMSHALTMDSSDFSLKNRRNTVLEQMCQSLDIESDLKKCIQDALAFHPGSGSRTAVKESVHSCEAGINGTFQTGYMHHGLENAKSSGGMTSSASTREPNHDKITELCRRTLFDIIMSEKFAQLCNLFLENGVKADKLLDLSHINSRMKEKAYESSLVLFHSDIQQIWAKLQKVGADMIALAKYLSDKTISSFREQVGSLAHSSSDSGRHEFLAHESDMHKAESTGAGALDKVHTCRRCGEKADGGNGLVCDSCEEMYHISCTEPPVEEIPSRSWYCASCTAKGIESPHDYCVACERLNASRSSFDGNGEDELVYEESPEELEESSDELVANEGNKRFLHCKVCRTEVRNDEDYRICGHSFCPHKFYHVKCLTSKQLISHGPCWYCPSCLCRACFTDQDDDKIVLCDGCDHAYHIYCMRPPRTTIPRGKWFCTKCNAELQRLHKAKQSYENMQNKFRKRSLDGKLKAEEALNKSGGVDMLLNAAKTLNYEENLAAMGLKSK